MFICLIGFSGSGKDTVGKIFEKRGFERISFASKVKDISSIIFGYDRDMLEGNTDDGRLYRELSDDKWSDIMEKDFTPRQSLIDIGMHMRKYDKKIWANSLFSGLDLSKDYVITDMRFSSEIECLNRYVSDDDIKVIQVSRPIYSMDAWKQKLLSIEDENEWKKYRKILIKMGIPKSEINWTNINFDVYIDNSLDIIYLENQVDNILKNI